MSEKKQDQVSSNSDFWSFVSKRAEQSRADKSWQRGAVNTSRLEVGRSDSSSNVDSKKK